MNDSSRGKVGTALAASVALGGTAFSSTVLSVAVALGAGTLLAVDGGDRRPSDGRSDDEADGSRVGTSDDDSNGSIRDDDSQAEHRDDSAASLSESDRSQPSSSAGGPDADDPDRSSRPPSIVERVDEVLQRDDWDAPDDSRPTADPHAETGEDTSESGAVSSGTADSRTDSRDASTASSGDLAVHDSSGAQPSDSTAVTSSDSTSATSSESDARTADPEATAVQDVAEYGACQNCGTTDAGCEPRTLGPRSLSVVLCDACESDRADRTRCLDDCRRTGVPLAATNADACQACGATASLEAHAVVSMDANGHRHQNNLLALCADCHAAVACHRDVGE